MRVAALLMVSSLLSLVACKGEQARVDAEVDAKQKPAEAPTVEAPTVDAALGSHTSAECRAAMSAFAQLDAAAPADIQTVWAGPLRTWVEATDTALSRKDAALIDESLTRLTEATDDAARTRERILIVTQLRTVGMLETRRLLTAVSDADPKAVPLVERARQWDDAWCIWEMTLRPLARRADGLPKRGGEDWEATIVEAFAKGRAVLDDVVAPKANRQIIEKGSYAVAHRLILANAEDPQPPAPSEAAALLDMLDDRIADRNGPGLKRMRQMFNGDPAAIDAAVIERELAVAFTKRARKYCDKAVVKAELGTPAAIAETWEGVVYTKVILPSMRDAMSAQGFDADAHSEDWDSYLEAVVSNDADAAATISARLVEWNCAYQDRLGIAACTASENEIE
jgi:hypothetical protein